MDIYKPSEEQIQPFLDQGMAGRTLDQWMEKFLSSLKTILLDNPLRYRAYGPYWWPLKKMFIDRSDLSFGDFIDAEWLSIMDYGKPEENIIAACIYEDIRVAKNLIDDPFHVMETADGADAIEYASNDPDMEMMVIVKGV